MSSTGKPRFFHIAFYRFVRLDGEFAPAELRGWVRAQCVRLDLCGSVILAPEGINGFLAGTADNVSAFWVALTALEPFRGLDYRKTVSSHRPFQKLFVKLKAEIIPMRKPAIQPGLKTGQRIQPQELKKWLDEGRPVRLLDTRNDYEVVEGTFEHAEHLGIGKFQDFAKAFEKWSSEDVPTKNQTDIPTVMFCTGGIRCEKATAFALEQGHTNVYQLDGGILGYFEECGGAHYDGGCFVFDRRECLRPV